MSGKFITFEGLDGAGKSTFIPHAREALLRRGREVVVTREPGGTVVGEKIRQLLLDPASRLSANTEALLMFAARQQHLQEVIWPAMERNQVVLCDRFTDSTFAYQGAGRGLPIESLAQLERWVQGNFQPDLTLLFDVDEVTSQARLKRDRAPDRFEQEATDFHRRVRQCYRQRSLGEPQRIRSIDASLPIPEIKGIVENLVVSICS